MVGLTADRNDNPEMSIHRLSTEDFDKIVERFKDVEGFVLHDVRTADGGRMGHIEVLHLIQVSFFEKGDN